MINYVFPTECYPMWRWFFHHWDYSLGWENPDWVERRCGFRLMGLEISWIYKEPIENMNMS